MAMGGDDSSKKVPTEKLPALEDTLATPERVTSPVHGEPSRARMFSDGEFLAGRYRVIRFIARGGMGEVYEVEDVELRSRIALKTIRPELADDEVSLERFRREIHLARKVTHPNVCRIFDLGHHLGRRGRVTFLTMELLDGESLLRRVKQRGPLPVAEALPIVEQMAAALGEAHALGIVHRDFKSDNVMLVAQPSGGVRAVVTDFGLARGGDGHLEASATRSGQMIGTPTYMAPEQLEGGQVGPVADIYALGVVMYEMVTGRVPFHGGSAFSVAVKRLHRAPDPPRLHTPSLDRRWEQVILRCLQREPSDRFARVGDVVAALRDPTQRLPVGKRRRWLRWAGVALLGAGAATATTLWLRPAKKSLPMEVSRLKPAHRALAVLGLRNLSQRADAAWLSTALSELVSGELAADDRVRRVPAESVSRARRDLALPEGESLSPDTLSKLRATLGVDYVVGGSYLLIANAPNGTAPLRLDLTLQDAQSGETLATVSKTGSESALFDLVARASGELRARLGGAELTPSEEASARSSLPADTEAARFYAEGLERLRVSDALAAKDLLEQAAAKEPEFPLVHAALADALGRLGHVAEQQREAKRAFDARSKLRRQEQLEVEARYHVAMREWPRAIELYRALVDFYPDSIEYALQLADVQLKAAQPKEALATVAQLRRQAPAAAADPRIDIVEGRVLDSMGDFANERATWTRAEDKARALGARQLLAEAMLGDAYVLSSTGEKARGDALAAQASALYDQIGDPKGIADAKHIRANLAWRAGELEKARALSEEALASYAKLGADGARLNEMINHSGILNDLGRFEAATREYQDILTTARQLGDKRAEIVGVTGLGQQEEHHHRFADAERHLREAVELCRAIHKRNYEGVALESLGQIMLDRGDARASADFERQAVAVYQDIADEEGVGNALGHLGVAQALTGDAETGAKTVAEGIAVLEKMGAHGRVASRQLEQATVSLLRGRLAEAETQARAGLAFGEQSHDEWQRTTARMVLVRVLLASGRVDEARTTLELAAKSTELDVVTTRAAVELAAGHAAEAIALVEPALKAMEPAAVDGIEARLVLARALGRTDAKAKGQALEKSTLAEAKKLGLVALTQPLGWLK